MFAGTELLSASERELQQVRGASMAMVFQDPMSSLNPVYRIGYQIVEQIRTHDHAISKAQATGPRRRADGACRDPARIRTPALLPARVLRWHAPAGDDRDGAVVLAKAADRPTSRPPPST